MADASYTQLSSIVEATYGVTPATPAFKRMRFTSENLKPSLQYVSSDEIRPDANVSDMTQVGGAAAGPVNMELSYGTFDDWLEGLMRNTWSTNVLKNGTTAKSFTLEKIFDNGATKNYHRYIGARVNTLNLNLEANRQITGSFDFMAKSMSKATAIISGATYVAANTNPPMNAADNVANLTMAGITSPQVTRLSLSLTNNAGQQPVIGSKFSKGIRTGRFVATGQLEAYFETADMFDAYVDNIATSLSFDVGGVSSLKYNFNFGKVKFTDAQVMAGGNDQDVMASMQFQAYFDGVDKTLAITRTP